MKGATLQYRSLQRTHVISITIILPISCSFTIIQLREREFLRAQLATNVVNQALLPPFGRRRHKRYHLLVAILLPCGPNRAPLRRTNDAVISMIVVIGIAGPTRGGKSTLANGLAAHLRGNGSHVELVHADRYWRVRCQLILILMQALCESLFPSSIVHPLPPWRCGFRNEIAVVLLRRGMQDEKPFIKELNYPNWECPDAVNEVLVTEAVEKAKAICSEKVPELPVSVLTSD